MNLTIINGLNEKRTRNLTILTVTKSFKSHSNFFQNKNKILEKIKQMLRSAALASVMAITTTNAVELKSSLANSADTVA